MDHPMVPAAEQHEVVEPGRPAVGPVPDMVNVAAPRVAAGEPALTVPRLQRPPQRRRDGPGLPPHIEDRAVRVVLHHDRPGIARHAAGGLGRHAEPVGVLERGVPGDGGP